ncbi:MAG: dUTP diphosphatase [Clostridiales bacterium]|uniref:dUTP diphosphatase n=1 Tax=Provencibacterium massiliense TaxID=1841868 RepID=UPI0009A8727F|nr:dUTP diphosphatase [Provencibacterium massiliense]PWM40860.1 MAG: dUTP diphosphatase [Clostridiales bacterium]RGB65761.1 dUTP diphosphatase [Harryflintia acetispora]
MEKLMIKRLSETAVLPARATGGSAGYDLCADIRSPVTILPGETQRLGSGIAIALPDPGYVALIFGRSGLGNKHGLTPANAVGVIDSDYRGELIIGLRNHGEVPYTVQPGERIAQLVVLPVHTPELCEVESLDETERGAGGFGSTGRGTLGGEKQ